MAISNLWKIFDSESYRFKLYTGFAEVQPLAAAQPAPNLSCAAEVRGRSTEITLYSCGVWLYGGRLKELCRACCILVRCNFRKMGKLT